MNKFNQNKNQSSPTSLVLKLIARSIHHITFAVLSILALLLVGIALRGMVKQYKYNQIPALTTQEAKLQKHTFRLGGVDFDIPMLYDPDNQDYGVKWMTPNPKRETIDAIRVTALLPDMDYFNEKTAIEFTKLGYGKTVMIFMSHYRYDWPYYFANTYKELIKLPEHPLVPDMFHYRDPMLDMEDVFLSHDQPVRDLIQMHCMNPELTRHPVPYPSCEVDTIYRNQFMLHYSFALEYMEQWQDINRKVKALLDSFITNSPTP